MKKKRLLTDKSGTLMDQMLEEKAKEMQMEIDREVLWGMLQGLGWKRIVLPRFTDNKHAVDISYWIDENIKGAFERRGSDFIFENPKDAAWFALRWL